MEVLRLLSCSCALHGVLPKVPPAASLPQGSEVDGGILYSILVAGGRGKLASWALWGLMPKSKRASSSLLNIH